MPDNPTTAPEFSRPIDVARIGSGATVHDISANPGERAALAKRFGLLDLGRLDAHVTLRRTHGGMLRLNAHLSADVTQACVVTLAPVPGRIEEDFAIVYSAAAGAAEVAIDAEEDSVREPWPEGPLDIGEAVAQELALALDPYPHAPGAALASPVTTEAPESDTVNPFAVLAKLKNERR